MRGMFAVRADSRDKRQQCERQIVVDRRAAATDAKLDEMARQSAQQTKDLQIAIAEIDAAPQLAPGAAERVAAVLKNYTVEPGTGELRLTGFAPRVTVTRPDGTIEHDSNN